MLRKLKIAPFTANFGTEQNSRSVRLGKPRRIAIPLHQGETFVEDACLDSEMATQGCIDGFDFFDLSANQQYLLRIQFSQPFHQPKNSRIARQIGEGLQPDIARILGKFSGDAIQPMLRIQRR